MPKHYDDFMCWCSPSGRGRCERTLYQVKKLLKTTDKDLLSAIVYGLEWSLGDGYSAHITWMGCDQWAGIGAKVLCDQGGTTIDIAEIDVQCDKLEHGLARLWQLCYVAAQEAEDPKFY